MSEDDLRPALHIYLMAWEFYLMLNLLTNFKMGKIKS